MDESRRNRLYDLMGMWRRKEDTSEEFSIVESMILAFERIDELETENSRLRDELRRRSQMDDVWTEDE